MTQPRTLDPGSLDVALVVNAGARKGQDALRQAELGLAQAGYRSVTSHPVAPGDDLEVRLRAAMDAAPGLLVIGGGDGTVGAAANVVRHTDTVLGVLPLGTANDFARTLEIPFEPGAAVETLTSGHVVDVDLGRVGERTFLNVASLGLSVLVTKLISSRVKKVLGPGAYAVATLRAYRHLDPFEVRLTFPDGDHETIVLDDVLEVSVGNGRHHGGGHAVAPNASVDDQLFDVTAIERGRLRDHLSIARLLKDGSFVEHDKVHHVTTRRVHVETDRELEINLDGELAAVTPASFEVERNALHVVVPTTSRAASLDE